MREVVQPAGMIVMMVSENHGGNIRGWVEAHLAQAWTDLFVRCHPDADLGSEKRIPPRQITGRGIFRAVARVYDEPALGMFDQPGEDLQAHPLFVAKNVDLPLEGIAPFAGAFLRRFQPSFACGNGSDADHREWRFMRLTMIRRKVVSPISALCEEKFWIKRKHVSFVIRATFREQRRNESGSHPFVCFVGKCF